LDDPEAGKSNCTGFGRPAQLPELQHGALRHERSGPDRWLVHQG
jgi:hypothetical protein